MSTQNESGILLAHAPNGVSFKLLELPPELLTLLESDEPPILSLESSETSALIRHGDKSWNLRQKNTSNALILLNPGETVAESSQVPESGLKAIATIHDTIELLPDTGSSAPVVAKGKWHEKFAKGR